MTVKLVKRVSQTAVFSKQCLYDARTALAVGLQEYIQELKPLYPLESARSIQLATVRHTWAAAEEPAEYPGICVYSSDEHEYTASSRFTPTLQFQFEDGSCLYQTSEINYELTIDLYCNDEVERMAIAKMLEDGLVPLDSTYGCIIEIADYYNARASYELMRASYADTSDSVQRRLRQATFKVAGAMPVYRLTEPRKKASDIRVNLGVSE